jgi:hypothetical protein
MWNSKVIVALQRIVERERERERQTDLAKPKKFGHSLKLDGGAPFKAEAAALALPDEVLVERLLESLN